MSASLFFVNAGDSVDEKPEKQCVDENSQTQSEAQQALNTFWPKVLEEIRAIRNVHYYFQLAQQHHANLQQNNTSPTTAATTATSVPQGAIQIVQPQQVQTVQVNAIEQTPPSSSPTNTTAAQPVILQAGQSIAQNQPGNVQIIQQILTPNGELQQIPINLTPQQLQMIKMQLQGNTSQPVIIQTSPINAGGQPQLIQVAQPNTGTQQVFLTQANGSTESE
ncbi:unnamed protein product [Brassicogethes aeneus]|uniref:Uncharacterized protein n=1 Tax=Brassicogethes aeneus TaxID=1431903 RepID=A0A9P0AYQ0_BRAAE|nr:unnamed protein product [Brassicogethes aeneus]